MPTAREVDLHKCRGNCAVYPARMWAAENDQGLMISQLMSASARVPRGRSQARRWEKACRGEEGGETEAAARADEVGPVGGGAAVASCGPILPSGSTVLPRNTRSGVDGHNTGLTSGTELMQCKVRSGLPGRHARAAGEQREPRAERRASSIEHEHQVGLSGALLVRA